MGDYYVRQLRGSAPLINDPLLVQYINGLGMRLVAHANSVRTPFHFYLINNDQINAFAFFGGNVVLHSALFRYSDTESELASVMAHEISHVTQRHLARAMEDQKRNAPLTWVRRWARFCWRWPARRPVWPAHRHAGRYQQGLIALPARMKKRPTASGFRCCSAPGSIRRPCRRL
ncbi:Putative Zn-dependent protease, contains TPR repeats [Raoultella terrigena]|uniref:Zn-dependent protease, contains TPR repeats n=1 Tax=Raoultella terrigena TaxID=577 RepID=A0A3P8ITH0_RAOTE|nr:Putative Zn-dependent protease, contains TPR repeats [Raoultella terrigena]